MAWHDGGIDHVTFAALNRLLIQRQLETIGQLTVSVCRSPVATVPSPPFTRLPPDACPALQLAAGPNSAAAALLSSLLHSHPNHSRSTADCDNLRVHITALLDSSTPFCPSSPPPLRPRWPRL